MSDVTQPVIELIDADIPRSEAPTSKPALSDVNWKIERDSFWVIGAFAGAGKSDLLATASGLQRPLDGELALFGRSVREMTEEELVTNRLKVAMVFSNGRLFSHLSITENIALPIRYHEHLRGSEAQERVRFALELTEISSFADNLPREVPRMLHQRIALARALALSPEVLLIDNPLASVDQRSARWWIDFVCGAHAGDSRIGRSLTLVIATDDLRPWIETANQFGVLREGRFETIGGRDAVKSTRQALVRELLTPAFQLP